MTRHYRTVPLLLALLLLFAPLAHAQDDGKTIVDLAVETDALSTLEAAVKAANLVSALKGDGPLTVFAPTNAAFNQLPAGTVETLTQPENREQLQGILKYHVVSGMYTAADLTDGQMLTTLAGDELEVNITDEGVMIGGATVVRADVMASNGVVHVIDHVLLSPHDTGAFALQSDDEMSDTMPSTTVGGGTEADAMDDAEMMDDSDTMEDSDMMDDVEGMQDTEMMDADMDADESESYEETAVQAVFAYDPVNFAATRTIPQNLVTADNFNTLVKAVQAAELADALGAEGPYTVFAPIDAAFDKVDGATMSALLEPSNKETLQSVLKYHVVEGRISAADLTEGMQLQTLAGENLTVILNDDSPTTWNVAGGDILVADLESSNGLIHVIDLVLIPEGASNLGATAD